MLPGREPIDKQRVVALGFTIMAVNILVSLMIFKIHQNKLDQNGNRFTLVGFTPTTLAEKNGPPKILYMPAYKLEEVSQP